MADMNKIDLLAQAYASGVEENEKALGFCGQSDPGKCYRQGAVDMMRFCFDNPPINGETLREYIWRVEKTFKKV